MDRYKEELDKLVEWLVDYTRVPYTGPESKKAIVKMKKIAAAVPSEGDSVELMRHMDNVAAVIQTLYGDWSETRSMYYPDNVMDHDTLLGVLEITEAGRFRQIVAEGYKAVYDKYDAPIMAEKFEKATKGVSAVKRLHRALKLINDTIDGLSGTPGVLVDLYIANRAMETFQPVLLDFGAMYLPQTYQNKETSFEEASGYVHRIAQLRDALAEVLVHYGIVMELPKAPEMSVAMEDLEELFHEYLRALRAIYVEVMFEKIIRVV